MEEEPKWNPTDTMLPPENTLVKTMDSSGRVSTLQRIGNLWFVPDGGMYVYYTPISWRHLTTQEKTTP
jgi:hypothetical protein